MSYNTQQLLDAIILDIPVEHSILIVGRHGIGKSEVVHQAGKVLGVPVVDYRLSQNDVPDMKGMPYLVQGRTYFAPPEWYPLTAEDAATIKKLIGLTEDINLGKYGDSGILFLDEINRGSKEVRQCCFQLVLDRTLNNRRLPPGWRVIAAVNPEDDNYDVYTMDISFVSRFVVVDYDPPASDWYAYAEKIGVHRSVYGFLKACPEWLDPSKEQLTEAANRGIIKLQDRRAWVRLSESLNRWDKQHQEGLRPIPAMDKSDENMIAVLRTASGYVGTRAAPAYLSYLRSNYSVLTAGQILNHWSDEVAVQIEQALADGQHMEITTYSTQLVDHIRKLERTGTLHLSKKQAENLYEYLTTLPNEMRSNYWVSWNAACPEISLAWYNADQRYGDLIAGVFSKAKR